MRTRKIMAISAVLAVLLIAFALMIAFSEPERLSISFGPVSYAMNRGFIASLVVTNTSKVSIEYSRSSVKLRFLGDHGWLSWPNPDDDLLQPVTVLEPGDNTTNWVALPLEARRWKVAYKVQTPSAQMKLWRTLPERVSARFWRPISKLVSDEPGKAQLIWSNEIDAQSWKDAHPIELLRAKIPLLIYRAEPLSQ